MRIASRMPYRCEATSVEGFIQQVAVAYLARGYLLDEAPFAGALVAVQFGECATVGSVRRTVGHLGVER